MFEAAILLVPLAAFLVLGGTWVTWVIFAVAAAISLPGLTVMGRIDPPYVPTPRRLAAVMLERAAIRSGETVYDLGCGDGRLVAAAARAGARAIGYELSVPAFLLARWNTRRSQTARIRFADFWKGDYRDADVVFVYLLPKAMERFHADIWPRLKPGCRVLSHAFPLPGVTAAQAEKEVFLYVR